MSYFDILFWKTKTNAAINIDIENYLSMGRHANTLLDKEAQWERQEINRERETPTNTQSQIHKYTKKDTETCKKPLRYIETGRQTSKEPLRYTGIEKERDKKKLIKTNRVRHTNTQRQPWRQANTRSDTKA